MRTTTNKPAPIEGERRVVVLNGSRITMLFTGGRWLNVHVA
ncbi:hypothetical protein QZM81_19460 [Burkholderia cepacia]|nr:hypothetical protein [Burkholderia cepacia]MDN7857985.1 hypothetical protein [Burkholderia cepacia]